MPSADGLPDHKQITQEFRLESDYAGKFNWQAGLFWFKEDIRIDSFNYDSLASGNPLSGHAIQEQENGVELVQCKTTLNEVRAEIAATLRELRA